MSNINDLAAKDFRLNDLPEDLKGFKPVLTIDFFNKRKIKKSIPTYLINILEKFPEGLLVKELENKIVSSKDKFILEKKAEIEKKDKAFREFIKGRITAVVRYYNAPDVIESEFNGSRPLILDKTGEKNKLILTYKLIPIKSE